MRRKLQYAAAIFFAISSLFTFTSTAAWAQVDATAELDALVQKSRDNSSGTALALRQIADGDLVGATLTLDRVLVNDPNAEEARLMRAGLFCRLDDPDGAKAELDELAGSRILDAHWGEIKAACGPIARPTANGGGK